MAEPPTSAWEPDYDTTQALLDAPLDARWKRLPGLVRHGFTHFPLELTVFLARVALSTPAPAGMRFTPRRALDSEPLPGVMKKVLAHAFAPTEETAPATRVRELAPAPLLTVAAAPAPLKPTFRPVPKPGPRAVVAQTDPDSEDETAGAVEAPPAAQKSRPARKRPRAKAR